MQEGTAEASGADQASLYTTIVWSDLGRVPLRRWMPTLLRIGRGMVRYQGAVAEPPSKLLRLWSYESNQFARLVRRPNDRHCMLPCHEHMLL